MTLASQQLLLTPPGSSPSQQPEDGGLQMMTWNVQHASPTRALRQAAWIAAQPVKLVVLTEVAAKHGGWTLAQALSEYGFTVCCPEGAGDYKTLIASRAGKLEHCAQVQAEHLPHRCVAVRLHVSDMPAIGVLGLYVPSRGSKGRRNLDKRAFQDAVARLLPGLGATLATDGPVLIAGDLNVVEPCHEPRHAVFGAWEYEFYSAFTNAGYADAFRYLYPERRDYSWYGRRSGAGYRFDHIFCSPVDVITDCQYLHHPRMIGLSDHSAMTATIALPPSLAVRKVPRVNDAGGHEMAGDADRRSCWRSADRSHVRRWRVCGSSDHIRRITQ